MEPSRRLAAALEPVIGSVYFARENHLAYVDLGFDPSPATVGEVQLPDGPAYFCSRGSCLGQVAGEVIAAAFGVFSPPVVVAAVRRGWALTDASTIAAARLDAVATQLERVLGPPDGSTRRVTDRLLAAAEPLALAARPLYAGLRSLPEAKPGWAALHRAGDLLRECRGDAHNVAWTATGLTAAEIGLLTEVYWGLPLRSYVRSRGWTSDELDAAVASLRSRAWFDEDGQLTADGRAEREAIERRTDEAMAPAVSSLGDDLGDLLATMRAWGKAIRAAGGYLAAGPHDLAGSPR